jgi:hypothetical protein
MGGVVTLEPVNRSLLLEKPVMASSGVLNDFGTIVPITTNPARRRDTRVKLRNRP